MAVLLPNGKQQYFATSDGSPLAGGKVYTYEAGTTTPKATYSDADGLVANANPVILDSRGEATIFWSGAYKVTVKDSLDNTIYTVDDISTVIDLENITYGGDSLSVILGGGTPHVVEDIDALKAVDSTLYTMAYVKGYYASGDGGGGDYWYDSGDTTTADNGGTVIVAADGARWKLQLRGDAVSLLQFGAKPDYTTNATPALDAAMDWAATTGATITIDGAFAISTAPTYQANVTLKGQHNPSYAQVPSNPALVSSCFVVSSSGDGSSLYPGSCIDGVLFLQQRFSPAGTNPLPFADAAAAAAGVAAFEGGLFKSFYGGAAHIKNCTFLGFSRVFDEGAFGFNGALFAENIIFDCKDGFFLGNQFSIEDMRSSFYNVHAYPVLTKQVTSAVNYRSGDAFSVDSTDADFNQCSAYGFDVGFRLTNAGTNIIGCSTLAPDSANTCIGFSYEGSGRSSSNIGSYCENMGGSSIKSNKPASGGIYFDTTITGGTFINGATATSADGQIWFYDGYGSIANCYFGGNTGIGSIKLSNTAGQVNIESISVPGDVAPIFGTASTILLARIGCITYRQAAPVLQPMSWTPVVKCGTTVQTGTFSGSYVVNNSFVTCYFVLSFSGGAPAGGTMTIEGLPYLCNYGSGVGTSSSGCAFYSNLTSAGFPHFNVVNGAQKIDCYYASATGSTVLAHGQLNNTTVIRASVTYKIVT